MGCTGPHLQGRRLSGAAVLFFEASHTYPENYHICCWRAPAELLEVTGRKRLGVAAICSKAVAEQDSPQGEQNTGDVSPKELYLPSHELPARHLLRFTTFQSRLFPPDSRQAPGTKLVGNVSLGDHARPEEGICLQLLC